MKKILFISIVTLMSVCIKAQDLEKIHDLLNNERYTGAETILEQKAGAEPELNYLLVKTYLSQDKEEEARQFLEQHQLNKTNDESDPMNRISYASYLLATGEATKAETIFNEVLDKRNSKNAELLMAIAEAYIIAPKGDAAKAIQFLEQAGKRDKKNPEIGILKGQAYRKLSDASKAYTAYQEALRLDPSNVKALFLLGDIFTTQKNADIYLEHFTKAYAIDSTYAPVLKALYDHYYFRDVKTARKYLEKYIAHSDYSLANEYRLTDILYLTGDYQEAIVSASAVMEKAKDSVQPRLYKLIAYSYAGQSDSAKADEYLAKYFAKEDSAKWVARDFEFKARLALRNPGMEHEAIAGYNKAIAMDSIKENKLEWAVQLAGLYKKLQDYANQAKWLGHIYEWKERGTNVDLFNWGIAAYNAKDYVLADTVFTKYTTNYPDNIFGYYWRAQVNAAVDTNMSQALAIPHYEKMIGIGEKDKAANKNMLIKAYNYLGGYEANITKNYTASLAWFEKSLELDSENATINKYAEMLRKWIAEGKKSKDGK